MEGLSKKEKGLMGMDNSVVMGRKEYKGAKWEWKKCNTKILKIFLMSTFNLFKLHANIFAALLRVNQSIH